MKKIILLAIILFSLCIGSFAYSPYIPKGTLVKVYTKVPLNTKSLEEGSRVYFIVPSDVWVQETKAIAKGDIFTGYVSMLKMPVQGVNAAMSIKIDGLIQQRTYQRNVDGRIIFSGTDVFGGTLTNPASYNKTIHPRRVYGNWWGGTLQWVPSGEYEFGNHMEVTSKDTIFVQFDENFYL